VQECNSSLTGEGGSSDSVERVEARSSRRVGADPKRVGEKVPAATCAGVWRV